MFLDLNLMLQEPYYLLGVTYSQASQVSFGLGTLVGSNLKFQEFLHAFGFFLTLLGSICKCIWLPYLLASIVE